MYVQNPEVTNRGEKDSLTLRLLTASSGSKVIAILYRLKTVHNSKDSTITLTLEFQTQDTADKKSNMAR